VLRQRAVAAGQSLQEYLRGRLIDEASAPTVEEILARAGGRAGGSVPFSDAVEHCNRIVLVVDARVLAPALADDGADGDKARARLRGQALVVTVGQALVAPELVDLETTSVISPPAAGWDSRASSICSRSAVTRACRARQRADRR
jgi:hypothetical protein